jgi:hypothetical protein
MYEARINAGIGSGIGVAIADRSMRKPIPISRGKTLVGVHL